MPDLADTFYNTFIAEGRYMFFWNGFKITLFLTVVSYLLGAVLGVLICIGRKADNRFIVKTVKILRELLLEIPTLVLLMILVYLVFGGVPVSALFAILIGLIIKSGIYLGDIIYSSLDAINPGEIEAARSLGMTKIQSAIYVVVPQSVKLSIPYFKAQFIVAMQETSIIGYLSILDLTRASDIVASRTLNPLFGLLFVALIYICIGFAGRWLIGFLDKVKLFGVKTK